MAERSLGSSGSGGRVGGARARVGGGRCCGGAGWDPCCSYGRRERRKLEKEGVGMGRGGEKTSDFPFQPS